MKPITLTFLAIGLISLCSVSAQTYDQAAMQLQFMNHYGKVAREGQANTAAVGNTFMFDQGLPLEVIAQDTTYFFESVQLDLYTGYLEVYYDDQTYTIWNIHFSEVRGRAEGKDRRWIPANRFAVKDTQLSGFVEVLGKDGDPVRVLANHHVEIKPPNPNANIVGGYTTDRRLKLTTLYLYDTDGLHVMKSKRDLKMYYAKQGGDLKEYLKSNHPNIKDPFDLQQLVEHLQRRSGK